MKKIIFLLAFSICLSASAFDYETPLPNAEQEKTAQEIFAEVRCLVCDGESLAESNADYSISMRALVREQIASGKDKDEVIEYLTERYGDGVLQSPPKHGGSLLLWFTPLLLIIFGAMLMLRGRKK